MNAKLALYNILDRFKNECEIEADSIDEIIDKVKNIQEKSKIDSEFISDAFDVYSNLDLDIKISKGAV